jgi:hypothetical protein
MVCAKLVTNLFPESVAIHLLVVITEWSICKGTALQIHVIQLSHVCSHNLISIDKNNLFESIRETTSLEDNETRIASTIEDHEAGLQVDHNIEKTTFLRESGNMTSKNKILYAHIIRCFSFCLCSHVGHLYVISSYSNPYSWAMWGMTSWQDYWLENNRDT